MFGGASSHGAKNSDLSTDVTSNNQTIEDKNGISKAASFKSKLPKKATDVLKTWFLNHINNPYPNHEDKDKLSQMTDLSRKQIQNWFTNSRKRFLEPLKKVTEQKKSSFESIQDSAPQLNNKIPESVPHIELPSASQEKMKSQIEPKSYSMNLETPSIRQQSDFSQQQQASPVFVSPLNINRQMPQNLHHSVNLQPQPTFFYQGYMPTNGINSAGNNIVFLNPYVMAQPPIMYPYRSPMANVIPLNASFVQIPQGSYIVPIQQNIVGMRSMPGSQNLSASYNTINNNIYNNNINNLPTYGSDFINYEMNSPKIIQSLEPHNFYHQGVPNPELRFKNPKGIQHSKVELNEVYHTSKIFHKDDGKAQDSK